MLRFLIISRHGSDLKSNEAIAVDALTDELALFTELYKPYNKNRRSEKWKDLDDKYKQEVVAAKKAYYKNMINQRANVEY